MLGPPSSSKTALVCHVVNQTMQDGTPMFRPISIDLCGVNVSTKDMFKGTFVNKTLTVKQTDPFWKTFLSEIDFEFDLISIILRRGGAAKKS